MDHTDEKIKTIISISFLAFTAFYCTFPLFSHRGLPYAQDMVFHIFQADQFSRAIQDGILFPKWVLDSNNGYGSPSFVFYAPLSYYAVALIKLFIPSLVLSMIVAVWCSFFLSGITMFLAVRKLFGDSGSLLSAVLYQILPFHVLDLYLRGTFAELFAFVWFPLIILYLYETFYSGESGTAFIALSLSYAGLILTHLASGFVFSMVMGSFLIYHSCFKEKRQLVKATISSVLGLGLASFYLIPAALERKFVQIEYLINSPIGDYKKNFLFVGGKFGTNLGKFYIPLHIGVILEVLFFILIALVIWRTRRLLSEKPQLKSLALLFLFALFLTTPLSRPLWDFLPGFSTLQFPWRWLSVVDVSICLLIGAVFPFNISNKEVNLKRLMIYLVGTLLLLSFTMISRSKTLPGEFVERILNPEEIKRYMDPPLEYTPIWAKNVREMTSEANDEKVSVISGSASVRITEWKSEKRILSVRASAPSILRISTFYYPGWKAWLDGNTMQIDIERESGAMLLGIQEGEHTLELKFIDTPLRFASKIVSLLSLFSIVLLALFAKRNRRNSMAGKE